MEDLYPQDCVLASIGSMIYVPVHCFVTSKFSFITVNDLMGCKNLLFASLVILQLFLRGICLPNLVISIQEVHYDYYDRMNNRTVI